MKLSTVTGTIGGLALLILASTVNAAWTLNNEASRLSFVSIKKDQVAEVHKFSHLSGTIADDGSVDITIQLASVDTAIPIRDERMRSMLFKTDLFPQAKVSGKVDLAKYKSLETGRLQRDEIEISLSMHDQSKTLKAEVAVVTLDGGRMMVTTISPLIINAADFDLAQGVLELTKIAELPVISEAVPVTLSLVFDSAK